MYIIIKLHLLSFRSDMSTIFHYLFLILNESGISKLA